MLGSDLVPVLAGAGYEVLARSRADLDITDAPAVARELAASQPDVVVNCAAFTKVDACETDPRSFAVNADAVGILADACGHRSCQLVQISTDFVFDGAKRAPYVEDDPTRPLSAYGRGKRGERSRRCSCPAASSSGRRGSLAGPAGTSSRRS